MTVTQWFPGDVKPVHEGVYQRNFGEAGIWYSRFDGLDWYLSYPKAKDAAEETVMASHQKLPWRGTVRSKQ